MTPWQRLDLGPAVVLKLLPQRPPFLFVDRIDAWATGTAPRVRTSRFLSISDPVFQGHFPELPLLPGALLVEAVGQTASLVYTLERLGEVMGVDAVIAQLTNLDRGLSLRPGFRPDTGEGDATLTSVFARMKGLPVGVAGEVRMKFLRPVTPGCRIVHEVQLTHRFGDQLRFDATVQVDDEVVARGSLAAAIVETGLRA
jgi:3-hydroxymyristoyl/3-hydroxydecanoyl-(acyl carrier protein) dehydratase